MGWLSDLFGTEDAKTAAANSAKVAAGGYETAGNVLGQGVQEAADISAQGTQQGIDYLQMIDQLPLEARNKALAGLSSFYQVPNQPKSQDMLLKEAVNSPIYKAMMESGQFGVENILKNASATGGLRSGGSSKDIYKYTSDLRNKALLGAYGELQSRDDYERALNLQGLTGLGNLNLNQNQIAQLMAGKGNILGAGREGAAQAQSQAILGSSGAHSQGQQAVGQIAQAGSQNVLDTILGGLQGFATAGGIPGIKELFSDIRLKSDIRYLGTHNGFNYYGWEWNEEAKNLGLEGPCSGVMAHEIYEDYPEAIGEKDGYVTVNYAKIGVVH